MTANKVADERNLVELQQDEVKSRVMLQAGKLKMDSDEQSTLGTLAPGKLIETNHRVDPNLTATVQVPIGTCENPPLIENRSKEPQVLPKVVVLPPVMTEDEARQCLQEIKGLFDSARAKLLEFKE